MEANTAQEACDTRVTHETVAFPPDVVRAMRTGDIQTIFNELAKRIEPTVVGMAQSAPYSGAPILGIVGHVHEHRLLFNALCIMYFDRRSSHQAVRFLTIEALLDPEFKFLCQSDLLLGQLKIFADAKGVAFDYAGHQARMSAGARVIEHALRAVQGHGRAGPAVSAPPVASASSDASAAASSRAPSSHEAVDGAEEGWEIV